MSDIDTGVDTDGAFLLGELFGSDEPIEDHGAAPAGDTPAVQVDAHGRAHGEDGKFVAQPTQEGYIEEVEVEVVAEPAEVAPEANDSTEEEVPAAVGIEPEVETDEVVLELDEDLLELVNTKYGGDLTAALRGLKEAQSLIGRQGSELGQTREENELLQGILERFNSLETRMTPYLNDVDENPEGLANEIVARAMETGDVRFLDDPRFAQAIEVWGEEEPFKAAQFSAQVNMAKMAAMNAQAAAEQAPETTLEGEMQALQARYPDLRQRLPAISEMAEKRPALAGLLRNEDPTVRAQALEDLYHLSAGATTGDTSQAARRIVLQARAEADAAKADATVVSASKSSAAATPPAKSGDQALQEVLQSEIGLGDDFIIVG